MMMTNNNNNNNNNNNTIQVVKIRDEDDSECMMLNELQKMFFIYARIRFSFLSSTLIFVDSYIVRG